MAPAGVTTTGLLVAGQHGRFAAFNRSSHRGWTASPAANQGGAPIMVGKQLYLLGKADVPASGLTAVGR